MRARQNEKLTRCLKNMRRLRARLRKFGRRLPQRQGAKADAPKVAALHKKACDSGYPLGCANPGLLYERGSASKNAHKAGENPAQGLRGEINLGDNAMLSEKDVASAKTICKRPAPTAGDDEAAKAIEKPQSSMINSDHRRFIV